MRTKAFTLIELLVVVAIIGILAAVGVVAYNGYTSSAKISATKANHKNIVKYIQNELMKCLIGGEIEPVVLEKSNPGSYGSVTSKFSCERIAYIKTEHLFDNLIAYLVHKNKNSKNVFDNSQNYFRHDTNIPQVKGFTHCDWNEHVGKGYCRTKYGDNSSDLIETVFEPVADYE